MSINLPKLFILFSSIITLNQVKADDMPKGGNVQSGQATISGYNTNHLTIDQKSQKSIINWDSFSIHSNGTVDFVQPNSNSFSLNRVTGKTSSNIAGKLNSNGKVMLINPNGIAITKGAVINTNSFTASTLDIKNKDFLNENYNFEGNGRSKSVINRGKILIGGGGHAALLGGTVSNSGTVTAKLGKIFLGSGERVTIDFVGDGLMKVTLPMSKLGNIKDVNGRTLKSIVSNNGTLKANGGIVQLSAADAGKLSRGSVNIGSSGKVYAKSDANIGGSIVIGGPDKQNVMIAGNLDVSSDIKEKNLTQNFGNVKINGGNVKIIGNIKASDSKANIKISSKRDLSLNGRIMADGYKGGNIELYAENSVKKAPSSYLDASGTYKGGRIAINSNTKITSSGSLIASSGSGYGGVVDISSKNIEFKASNIDASGLKRGGLVRIGGELQGGNYKLKNSQSYREMKIVQKANTILRNAEKVSVDNLTSVNVSSKRGKGGVAIIWSEKETRFSGQLNATGKEFVKLNQNNQITKFTGLDPPPKKGDYEKGKDPPITEVTDRKFSKLITNGFDPPVNKKRGNLSSSDNIVNELTEDGIDKLSKSLLISNTKAFSTEQAKNQSPTMFDISPPPRYDKGGGFVEISSKELLKVTNFKNIEVGNGTLLLDPRYIRIQSSDSDAYGISNGGLYAQNSSGTTILTPGNITSLLNAGTDVTLQAHHTIFVDSSINANSGSSSDLTLQAGFRVDIDANIDIADGDLTIMTNDLVSNGVNAGLSSTNGTLVANGYTLSANNITIDNMGRDSHVPTNSFLPAINAANKITIRGNAALGRGGTGITHRLYGNLTANGTGNAIEIASARLRRYNNSTLSAPNGRWLGWKTTSDVNHLIQENNRQNADFKEFGKTYGSNNPTPASGNGYLFSYNRDLTKTINSATKTYDGTTAITTGTGLSYSSVNTYHGDTITLDSPDATFDNKNAGSSKSVTANSAFSATSSLTTGISGTGETTVLGYQVATGAVSSAGGVISRKSITLSGDRFYNGTNVVQGSDLTEFTTLISGESLNVNGSGTVSRLVANLGDQSVSLGSIALQDSGSHLASNYTLSSATYEITRKPVTVSGSKFYDGDNDVLASEVTSIVGTVGSETLTMTGQGTTANKNVGSGLTVTTGTLSLDDGIGAASNYIINGNITFDINSRVLSIDAERPTNGTTTVASSDSVLSNLVSGESLNLSGSGVAAQSSAGTDISISDISNFTLADGSGGLASNYTLTGGTHLIDITATSAFISGTRIYDGLLTIDGSILSFVDPNDSSASVTISGTGSISNADVGSYSINVSGLSLSGTDAGNYNISSLSSAGNVNVTIGKRSLNLSGSKTYDGTNDITESGLSIGNTISGDTVSTTGTATLLNAAAGTREINVDNLNLTGTDAGNYTLTDGTHQMTVNPVVLNIHGTKVYDGDTTANVADSEVSIQNLVTVGGVTEGLRFTGTGTAASKDVIPGNTTLSQNTLAIADQTHAASNYTFSGATMTFNITEKAINTNFARVYDGTNVVSNTNFTSATGLIGSESITMASGSGTVSTSDQNYSGSSVALDSTGSLALGDGSNGGLAQNYTFSGGSHNLTISQRPLDMTGTKIYDGNTVGEVAELTLTNTSGGSTGLVDGDSDGNFETLSLGGNSVTIGSKDVANSPTTITNAASRLTKSNGSNGGLANNYTFSGGTHTFTVTTKQVNFSRVYNDLSTVVGSNLNSTLTTSDTVGSETLTMTGTGSVGSQNYSGSSQSITLGTLTLGNGTNGGLATNYSLSGSTLTINKRPLNIDGSKTYDGNTDAANSLLTLSNLATDSSTGNAETLGLAGTSTISSKNAGSRTITNAASALTLSNGSNGGLANNYTFTGGTHNFTINTRPLTVSGTRQYDGTTVASSTDLSTLSNFVGSETVTLSGNGSVNSANVANNYSVNTSGLSIVNGSNGGLSTNYNLTGGSYTLDITKRNLSLDGTRVYDNINTVQSSELTLSNLVSGENLTLSGSGSIASANVGANKTLTLGSLSISDGAGGDADNYQLSGGSYHFDITRRPISLSGSRLYDATTNATASDLSTHGNVVGSQTLSLSGTGTISNKNVGANKTVSTGTLALGDGSNGGLASNYTLTGGTHQLTVNQRPLNATLSRQYDATTTSAGSTLSSFNALQGGENLTMTGSGTASSENVSNGISMSNNGDLALADGTGGSAGLASNYSLNSTVINITKRVLNSSGSKVYDANTDAIASVITLSNLVGSETLSHSGTASTNSANAGSYSISNLSGISLADGSNGGLASNYTLSSGTHDFTINRRVISVSGTRLYDATTNANASDLSTHSNLVGSQTLGLSGVGSIASKNVESNKTVSSGTLALADGSNGGLAANYTLSGGTHRLTVNQRPLIATLSRQYDATTTAAGSTLSSFNALQGGENLTMTGSGTASSANVANNISMTSNGDLALADGAGGLAGLASNYSLNSTVINIIQKPVNTSGTRTYDATTNVASGNLTVSGELGSEQLSITGNGAITNKNVGTGKSVNTTGLTLQDGSNGGLAANYTLSGGTHTFNITEAPISFTGTRAYDASTNVEANNLTLSGEQGGEDLTVSGTGSITSKDVGNGKTANVSGLTLGNGVSGTAGLASNYTFSGGTHTFDVTKAPLTVTATKPYDGTVNFDNTSISISGLQASETLLVDDDINTNSSNVGTYNTGSGNLLITDINNAATSFKKITNHGAGGGNNVSWPGTSDSALSPEGGESEADFIQRALELMNTSGSGIAYMQIAYTDSSKTTISLARAKSNATSVGSNNTSKDIYTIAANENAIETATGKTVSDYTAGFNLINGSNGGLASNYTITSHSFTISRRVINLSGTRLYDATTNATASDLSTHGNVVGSQTLSLSGTGSVISKNVSVNKDVSIGTLALADGSNGGLAANYTLSSGTHQLTVNQRPLNATLARQYDATTTSAGSTLSSFDALQGGENLTMTGSGIASSANVTNSISMADNGNLSLADGTGGSAGLASNYSLNSTVINITQRVLNSSGSKVYDANTDAIADAITLSNLAGGESLVHSGTASTSSANAGNYTINNLSGTNISNGTGLASNYTLTGGTHDFTIEKRVLSVSGTRLYDATTNASSSDLSTHSNLIGSQTLSLSGTGSIVDKNVQLNKVVSVGSLSLADGSNGGLASNYTLTGGTHRLSVTQRPLVATLSRQYDGTTTSAGSTLSSFDALQGGENLTMNGTGTAASLNVANAIAMSNNGDLALSNGTGALGGLASNYRLDSTVLNITKRVLNSTGNKIYDASTDVTAGSVTLANIIEGETLNHSGTATLTSANARDYTITNLSGISLSDGSGVASNYTLTGGTHNFTVNRRQLIATLDRQYDGTKGALGSDLSSFDDLQNSETLTLNGSGTVLSENVANGLTLNTLGNLTLVNGTGLASNYTLNSGILNITKRVLNSSGSKTYDGTTAVSDTDITLSNLVGNETLLHDGNATLSSANAGSYSISNLSGISITTGTGDVSNYTLSGGSHNFTVNPRVINLGGGTRQYDGTTVAIAADLPLTNLVGSETLALSGNAVVENPNVGVNKELSNISGLTLVNGTNGGLASNYTLTGSLSKITITPRVLSSNGSKIYDGTTNVNASQVTLSNLVGSETLSLSGFGTVLSENAGASKTVSLNTLIISNNTGLSSNYSLNGGTHTFDINTRTVTFSGARVYDGTTTVANGDLTTISNLVTGETLGISGAGSVTSKDVGTNKSITAGSLSLSNGTGLASNYSLGSGTFDISQKWVSLTGSKSYDGNRTVDSSNLTIGNLISGESLNLSGSGTVQDSAVGTNKNITLGTLTLGSTGSGAASNYTFGSTSFDITKRVLGGSGSRIYDGSTDILSSDITLNNLVGGETLTFSGVGSVSNAGVQNNKSVSAGSFAINDGTGSSGNYTLDGGVFTISVTTRPLTLTGTRSYNGGTTVNNSKLTTFSNLVNGESLGLSGSGSVADANVGLSKTVTLGTLALEDGSGSASNYELSNALLDITAKAVTLNGSKSYDGTTQVQSSDLSISNLVGSETLNLSGSGFISSPAVGNNYVITVDTLTLADGTNGGLASNYTFVGGSKTFNVTQRVLNLSGSRAYDSTTNAASGDLAFGNLVGNETLTITGNGTVATANVANNKVISIGTLDISDGTGASSNYTLDNGTFLLNITPRPITLSGSRIYDGTNSVLASDLTTFNNLISGETLEISGSGTTTNSNTGTALNVTLGSLSLSDGSGSASNYTLNSAALDISQRQITISGSRVYNGLNTVEGGDFTSFTNIVNGETLIVSGSGTVTSGNIGSSKSVTSIDIQINDGNASAANYVLDNSISVDITARSIDLSGTKVYDGSRNAESSRLSIGNLVNGESINITGTGTLASAAVGSQTIVNLGTLSITDGTSSASNYAIDGTLSMTVTSREVTVSGTKVYDGTRDAPAANLTNFSNLVSGETLSLSGTGQIASENVGASKTVTQQTLSLANGSGAASNYSLGAIEIDVTQRVINLDGIRSFDGTSSISGSDIQTFGNIVSGETLVLSGTGSVPNANAEMNKSLSLGTLTLGDGNTSASNYTLSGGSHTYDISQLSVNVTGSKIYDGSTTVNGSILSLTNLVSGETVSLTGSGSIDSAAVGANKTVNSGTLALTGSGSGNYTLSSYTTTFEVLPRPISLSGSRQYNGSASADNSDLTMSNLVSGESLNLSGAGTVLSAAVGSNKTISSGSLSLTNGSGTATNYTLTGGTLELTITQRQLTLSGTRVYDGTNNASNADLTNIANLVGSETLTLGGTGTVTSASVGSNKNVTLNNLTLVSGTGVSSNYSINSASLTISKRPVSIDGTRTYDGTTNATASDLTTMSNLVTGETLSLSGTGSVGSAAVGNDKSITIGTLSLSDGSGESDNYTLTGGTLTLDVTKRDITLSGTRSYNGTNVVSNTDLTTFSNLVGGESLSITGSGTILSGAVGSNKAVTIGTLALSNNTGAASNYNLDSASLTVTQRIISLSGSRFYNGNTTINNSDINSLNNIVSGESLSLSGTGTVVSANAGNNKSLSLGSLSIGDGTGSVSNYTLTGGSHTVNINKRVINLSGSRVYDGSGDATAAVLSTMSNLVSGETLSLSGTGSVDSAAVAANKTVNIGSLTLSDGSGESDNYTLTAGTHTIEITKKTISASGSRSYDGSTDARGTDLTVFSGLVGSESLSLSGSGSVVLASVGSNKSVNLENLTLQDGTGAASNYNLNSATLTINKRVVNITASKVYDGTTNIQGTDITNIDNLVNLETLTLSGTGSVNSSDVSNNVSLTLGSLNLANGTGASSNYSLSGGTHRANINQRPVDLSGSRIYDGTTVVSSGSLGSLGNLVSGETLSISGNGSLPTKNVGRNKILGEGSLNLSDGSGDADNYTLSGGSLLFNVTPKSLAISGTRTYDGTTEALGNDFNIFSGIISGETITINGSGSIPTSSVGSKNVSIGSLNASSNNYLLSNASLAVTKRLFNLSGSRSPSSNTNIQASELIFSNLVRGESLVLSGVGYINNARVIGTYDINIGTLNIGDNTGLASNYDFGNLTFRISHRVLNLRGRAHILFRLKNMENINDKLFPSKIRHRSRVGLDRKVTVTAPDQSISISPCTMTDGFCN